MPRVDPYTGHITWGGHFATFASKEVPRDFPEVDSIRRQEAEETLRVPHHGQPR